MKNELIKQVNEYFSAANVARLYMSVVPDCGLLTDPAYNQISGQPYFLFSLAGYRQSDLDVVFASFATPPPNSGVQWCISNYLRNTDERYDSIRLELWGSASEYILSVTLYLDWEDHFPADGPKPLILPDTLEKRNFVTSVP